MAKRRLRVQLHSLGLTSLLKGMEQRGQDLKPVWRHFAVYMGHQTGQTFERLRLGGTYRGITWKYFSPNYIGKKRPSGQIVEQGDALLDDTGTLKGNAIDPQLKIQPKRLVMGVNLDYAAKQQRMRPFLFFHQPKDSEVLDRMMGAYAVGGMEALRKIR